MVRGASGSPFTGSSSNETIIVAGAPGCDGACAGCGEKSVLRAVASTTEAYMRPLYHAKAARLLEKAEQLEQLVNDDQVYAAAKRRALRRLKRGYDLGTTLSGDRTTLHDRENLR